VAASRLAMPEPAAFRPQSRLKAAAGSTPHPPPRPSRPVKPEKAPPLTHPSFVGAPGPPGRASLTGPPGTGSSQSTTDTKVSVVSRPQQDARLKPPPRATPNVCLLMARPTCLVSMHNRAEQLSVGTAHGTGPRYHPHTTQEDDRVLEELAFWMRTEEAFDAGGQQDLPGDGQ
jgi:hypothetical protein